MNPPLQTFILLCAVHSLAFALFHCAFWKIFRWPRSLAGTTLPNRAIIQILNLRLIWVLAAVGKALLAWPADIAQTKLGQGLLGFMCVFWIGRTNRAKFVFLRINHAFVHLLTCTFALGAMLFGWAWWLAAQG